MPLWMTTSWYRQNATPSGDPPIGGWSSEHDVWRHSDDRATAQPPLDLPRDVRAFDVMRPPAGRVDVEDDLGRMAGVDAHWLTFESERSAPHRSGRAAPSWVVTQGWLLVE
jgi:hypothetical protein